jgi:hypothetical protein
VALVVGRARRQRRIVGRVVHDERPVHEANVVAVRLADLGERLALLVAPRARVLVGDHDGQRRLRRADRRRAVDADGVDLRGIGALRPRRGRRRPDPRELRAHPLHILAQPRDLLAKVLVVLVAPDDPDDGRDGGQRELATHAISFPAITTDVVLHP